MYHTIHTHHMLSILRNLDVSSRSAATRFALDQQHQRAKNLLQKDRYARLETSLHGYPPRLSIAPASKCTGAMMLDEFQRRCSGQVGHFTYHNLLAHGALRAPLHEPVLHPTKLRVAL